MIRFAWTPVRTQAAVAVAALAIVAVVLAVTGLQLAHFYDTVVATCGPRQLRVGLLNVWP